MCVCVCYVRGCRMGHEEYECENDETEKKRKRLNRKRNAEKRKKERKLRSQPGDSFQLSEEREQGTKISTTK